MNNLKVFFRIVGCIILLGVLFYFSQLYYFFYQDVMKTENAILRHQIPFSLPNAKENYVSTWGAFGDFVGGTLNPFLTCISICLILWTIRQNRKMLDNSSDALESSIAMQNEVKKNSMIQILDNRLFAILEDLSYLQSEIKEGDNFSNFYSRLIDEDIDFKDKYNKIFFKENEKIIYFIKKVEFLFNMINQEVYSTYEKDLQGLREYQKIISDNESSSNYILEEFSRSKITVHDYLNIIKYMKYEEYKQKEIFEKTEEFNIICSINRPLAKVKITSI